MPTIHNTKFNSKILNYSPTGGDHAYPSSTIVLPWRPPPPPADADSDDDGTGSNPSLSNPNTQFLLPTACDVLGHLGTKEFAKFEPLLI